MDIRKVICMNSGAFFITLPIEYCRKHSITKGCYIMTSPGTNGELVITPVPAEQADTGANQA